MIQITNRNISWCLKKYSTSIITNLLANSLRFISVKLAYASYESLKDQQDDLGTPLMLMHGLFGSKTNWNSLAKAIHQQTNRKVHNKFDTSILIITIDARNHGDSPHTKEMTYPHMALDVIELLNDLKLEEIILLGHSMGGSCMMYVALNYPELVEKLIVVDMSPIRRSSGLFELNQVFQAMNSVPLTGSSSLAKARKTADESLARTITNSSMRQFLLMNLIEVKAGTYKWRMNLPVLEKNFLNNLSIFPDVESKIYQGPTLFIGGSESDYINKNDHEAIKKLFPQAVFEYVPNARHWVHADKPQEFLKLVERFIKEKPL